MKKIRTNLIVDLTSSIENHITIVNNLDKELKFFQYVDSVDVGHSILFGKGFIIRDVKNHIKECNDSMITIHDEISCIEQILKYNYE